jgi:intracellular multiplication protein IcmK
MFKFMVAGTCLLFSCVALAQSPPAAPQDQSQQQAAAQAAQAASSAASSTAAPASAAPASAPPAPGVYPGYGQPASSSQLAYSPSTNTAPQQPPGNLPPLPSDFQLAAQATLGMTPSQIIELHRMLDERQRAVAKLPSPPRSVTGTVSVSMAPGATPPVIRPFIGITTSFTVVDAGGAAWPVENFRVGNAVQFQVNRLDGPGGSVFTIDTMETYGQTNLVLKLAGSSTPIVINIVAGQKVQDARVEIRVEGRGPNSSAAQSAPLMHGTDARLLSVLDGMAPAGGHPLTVVGSSETRAWMMPTGHMVVRTPLVVVSPASIGGGTSFVSSADGTHVYEFMPSPNILAMVDNQFVNLTIQGW